MTKLNNEISDNIDIVLYNIADKMSLILRKNNHIKVTPNLITLIRLIIGIKVVDLMNKGRNQYAAILFFLWYFLDCLDGHYARKYDMVTVFGDYFDHLVDTWLVSIILLNIYNRISGLQLCLLIIMLIGLVVFVGCQERILGLSNKDVPSLTTLQNTCPEKKPPKVNKLLKLMKNLFIGPGSFSVYLTYLIYTLPSK